MWGGRPDKILVSLAEDELVSESRKGRKVGRKKSFVLLMAQPVS